MQTAAAPPRSLGPIDLLRALYWLTVDTFRQSLSSFIFWLMAVVAGAAILFCLGIGMEGGALRMEGGHFLPSLPDAEVTGMQRQRAMHRRALLLSQFVQTGSSVAPSPSLGQAVGSVGLLNYYATAIPPMPRPSSAGDPSVGRVQGQVTYLFGLIRVDLARDREKEVKAIHVVLGQWVAGVAGLLLAIIWTAGFLPAFLEANAVTVLLAKPVPRGVLLVGKFLGVVIFLAVFCGVFIVGTWWALALKTGIWATGYLLCWPLLVFHFTLIYSFSALLAVMTRSTAVCIFGSILFWLICYGVNYGRHLSWGFEELAQPSMVASQAEDAPTTPIAQRSRGAGFVVDAGYWLLPKPIDIIILVEDALQASEMFGTLSNQEEIRLMRAKGAFSPGWSLLSSFLGACLFLAIAAYEFRKLDY